MDEKNTFGLELVDEIDGNEVPPARRGAYDCSALSTIA